MSTAFKPLGLRPRLHLLPPARAQPWHVVRGRIAAPLGPPLPHVRVLPRLAADHVYPDPARAGQRRPHRGPDHVAAGIAAFAQSGRKAENGRRVEQRDRRCGDLPHAPKAVSSASMAGAKRQTARSWHRARLAGGNGTLRWRYAGAGSISRFQALHVAQGPFI